MKPTMMIVTALIAGAVLATANIVSTPKIAEAASNLELVRLVESSTGTFLFAPGDTLKYTARWPKWKGATSYQYSVRASTLNWTVPTNVVTIDTTAAFNLINTTAWDTVTFRFVVKGINTGGVSKDSATVTWRVVRPMTPGGPPVIDSSKVVWAILIKPDSVQLATGTLACQALGSAMIDTLGNVNAACMTGSMPQIAQFCAFFQMLDKKYYMGPTDETNRYLCRRQYDKLPEAGRLPGYPDAVIASNKLLPVYKVVIDDSREKWSRASVELAVN